MEKLKYKTKSMPPILKNSLAIFWVQLLSSFSESPNSLYDPPLIQFI